MNRQSRELLPVKTGCLRIKCHNWVHEKLVCGIGIGNSFAAVFKTEDGTMRHQANRTNSKQAVTVQTTKQQMSLHKNTCNVDPFWQQLLSFVNDGRFMSSCGLAHHNSCLLHFSPSQVDHCRIQVVGVRAEHGDKLIATLGNCKKKT